MVEANRETLHQAARHLLQHPLTCAETHEEMFATIRRHEQQLDRWFTQRLGYRLQVNSTTARLFKNTVVPHRPVLTAPVGSKRPMSQRECMLLTLTLAALAAGPRIISLRDLVNDMRSQATAAEITLTHEPIERRALVVALKWMIKHGLLKELHDSVEHYEHDDSADAILEIDFDRISILPLPALGRATTATELMNRDDRRANERQWMRAWLVENPVLYKSDITDREWSEIRRRIGEEITMLDEMFGLQLEVRAEGLAAIDPRGRLSDKPFPATGTTGHAALLFIESLLQLPGYKCDQHMATDLLDRLGKKYSKHWSKVMLENPTALLAEVKALLIDVRLIEEDGDYLKLLPAAFRYQVTEADNSAVNLHHIDETTEPLPEPTQDSLW